MPYGSKNRGFVRICLPQKYALSSGKSRFLDDFGAEFIHRFIITSDGSSSELALPVPPREESLNSNSAKRPFSRYSAEITLSDGSKFTAYGINVFADTTVFLRLNKAQLLLPPPALWFSGEVEKDTTTISKSTFNPDKKLSLPAILHLQSNNKESMPEAVPKTDYAATVLSQAVYPTWNRYGLNTLSILLNSILLNRLHYRCLPYRMPWDGIYYCPYYPIYDTVANATKETASLYATDSTGAPICYDGLFSDQNTLWQIESQAEQGFSPLDIIRKLFGNNSCIMESKETAQTSNPSFFKNIQKPIQKTPYIKEKPRSAKSSTIRESGISALNLQNCLNIASKYIASVPVAGYGGTLNELAHKSLRSLQKYLGLNATGEPDDITCEALYRLKKSIDNGSFFDYPGFVLKFGSCGHEVKRLKNMLSVLAKTIPCTAPKSCDEIFDSDTELSLIRAQRALNCLPTGKADRDTWEKIIKAIRN